jgi:hypothetical protein
MMMIISNYDLLKRGCSLETANSPPPLAYISLSDTLDSSDGGERGHVSPLQLSQVSRASKIQQKQLKGKYNSVESISSRGVYSSATNRRRRGRKIYHFGGFHSCGSKIYCLM